MCDAVYLNPLDNFKKWYTHYGYENEGKKTVRLNTVILTEVKVKSINNVAIPNKASDNWKCDTLRLGAVYFCDESNDEILETIFSKEELNY